MTAIMQKAFQKAFILPEIEQSQLARVFIEEMDCEQKWDMLFADTL